MRTLAAGAEPDLLEPAIAITITIAANKAPIGAASSEREVRARRRTRSVESTSAENGLIGSDDIGSAIVIIGAACDTLIIGAGAIAIVIIAGACDTAIGGGGDAVGMAIVIAA